jgi:hypothetical protein
VSSPVDVPLFPGSRPRRLAIISHHPPTLLTVVSRLSSNGSWPWLCSLSTDRTENTAPTALPLLCVCCCHYLATAVVWQLNSWSLPSNGSICYNILLIYLFRYMVVYVKTLKREKLGLPVSRVRVEPGTSRTQVISVTPWANFLVKTEVNRIGKSRRTGEYREPRMKGKGMTEGGEINIMFIFVWTDKY